MAEKIITIITMSYNKAPYIKDWAKGLAKQTYLDKMKILVIDDGSIDGSPDLIKKYAAEYNLPLEMSLNGKNLGLMYSTKQAYKKIDTKYFAVLDSDDYYLSPQKVEKAVKFLESHPDYSCYACNTLLETPDGSQRPYRPEDVPDASYTELGSTPFFQTASTTFRKFFSPELLDAIDKETGTAKRHAFEADAFRNILAFHFGKLYFENSLDCIWRNTIGAWGKISAISKELSNMKCYRKYFEFYTEQFGLDRNAHCCLTTSYKFYREILSYVGRLFEGFIVTEFKKTDLFKNILAAKEVTDLNLIFNELVEQYKYLESISFKLS